jgi:hypothetical protein
VTDGHAIHVVVAREHERVADPLRSRRSDLALEVEAAKDGVRELANLLEQRRTAVRGLRGERVSTVGRVRDDRLGRHHRETAWPETVPLIEAECLGMRR